MLRPSLSGLPVLRSAPGVSCQCVAGAYAPAFVERLRPPVFGGSSGFRCVAGAYAPAFVERSSGAPCLISIARGPRVAGAYAPAFVERRGVALGSTRPGGCVSPELMLRPSLSARASRRSEYGRAARVAGAYAPAFVERQRQRLRRWSDTGVSPELMLRPSLSAPFQSRRSSAYMATGVAGAYAPAFVERAAGWRAAGRMCRCRRSLCSGLR